MKLRNKKTGEIRTAEAREGGIYLFDEATEQWYKYELELLADCWEYYKEPKEYWYYDTTKNGVDKITHLEDMEKDQAIGNYFETREDADRAVEKLKALKILNDNGFRIIDWEFDPETVADGKIWFDVGLNTQWDAEQLLEQKPEVKEALDTLFGGEE